MVATCLALCTGCAALANDADEAAYTKIQFDANASQLVENDSMRARLFVEVQDSTPSTAAAKVTQAANDALRALRQETDLRVRSGAYRTWPTSDKGRIIGWRARSEIIIESDKIEQVSTAIASVSDTMQLASVEFFPSTTLRDQVETVLIDQAIKAFQAKAGRIAKSFGATRFEVAEAKVTSVGNGVPPRPMMRAMSADAAGVAPDFGAGTTRLSVSVTGTILIPR
ncbi:MAG: SIMPL domain-containing protein [Betaproteobacteria bacterium]|nr:MAG: SIMPL domain-containing protein [Betaproteobacteria bacterium]